MDKIKKMKENLDSNYGKFIGPIDCKGRWVCNEKCIREFKVDVLPKYGGEECPTGSAPDTGLGPCIPGSGSTDDDCPLHQDCVWRWSECGSNCKRSIIIDTPHSGDGIPCPGNTPRDIEEAKKQKQYISCVSEETLDTSSKIGLNYCYPKSCEGEWGSCGDNCEQIWNVTKPSIPADEYDDKLCPYKNISRPCSGDSCKSQPCEWHWKTCRDGIRQSQPYVNENGEVQSVKYVITSPAKHGGVCDPLDGNIQEPPCTT